MTIASNKSFNVPRPRKGKQVNEECQDATRCVSWADNVIKRSALYARLGANESILCPAPPYIPPCGMRVPTLTMPPATPVWVTNGAAAVRH